MSRATDSDAYDLFHAGVASLDAGRWGDAAAALERARALEPGKSSIDEALGRACFHEGRFSAAAEAFGAVVDRHPSNDFAHFCLGRSFQKLGRRVEARRHFELACGLRPDRADYRRYRSMLR